MKNRAPGDTLSIESHPLLALPVLPLHPPIVSCEGCGACCQNVAGPPSYALRFRPGAETLVDGQPRWRSQMSPADVARTEAMPAELLEQLGALYRNEAELQRRERARLPCLWYDRQTGQCRHHEWRPQGCRDFERGAEACRLLRKNDGLPA